MQSYSDAPTQSALKYTYKYNLSNQLVWHIPQVVIIISLIPQDLFEKNNNKILLIIW